MPLVVTKKSDTVTKPQIPDINSSLIWALLQVAKMEKKTIRFSMAGSYPAVVTIVRAGSILERGDVRLITHMM